LHFELHKTEEDRVIKEQKVFTKNTWARLARYVFIPHNFQTVFIQGHRKRWTGFETAITERVLDLFTRLAS